MCVCTLALLLRGPGCSRKLRLSEVLAVPVQSRSCSPHWSLIMRTSLSATMGKVIQKINVRCRDTDFKRKGTNHNIPTTLSASKYHKRVHLLLPSLPHDRTIIYLGYRNITCPSQIPKNPKQEADIPQVISHFYPILSHTPTNRCLKLFP